MLMAKEYVQEVLSKEEIHDFYVSESHHKKKHFFYRRVFCYYVVGIFPSMEIHNGNSGIHPSRLFSFFNHLRVPCHAKNYTFHYSCCLIIYSTITLTSQTGSVILLFPYHYDLTVSLITRPDELFIIHCICLIVIKI